MSWPPDLGSDDTITFAGLSTRAAEALYDCHHKFAFSGSTPEFIDVNNSLQRLLQLPRGLPEGHSPWSTTCPTLTGACVPCVRYDRGGGVVLRPIRGYECMQLAGWDRSYFREELGRFDDKLLINISGNMFSAFALAPALVALFYGWPDVQDFVEKRPGHNSPVDCGSDSDSSATLG